MEEKKIKYPINEYFLSIQGEGSEYGELALFLRFGKCNLRCSFCDTESALDQYEFFSLNTVKNILNKYHLKTNRLIITGGEPILYDLKELIKTAKRLGYKISVETNGTLYQEWLKNVDHITVSPKDKSKQNKETLKLAKELKFVIQKKSDFKFVEKFMPFKPSFLVPADNDTEAAGLIFNYLKKSKFKDCLRLGVQMQKVYGIR